jgi:integrase
MCFRTEKGETVMAKKRANNEGTIYFHKTRSRWCAQVSLDGRRITKYGKTQKECREWVKEMLTKIDGGLTYPGLNLTLERYLAIWLNGKELSQRPKTLAQYRMITEQYINPGLGRKRLQDIHPIHINLLYQARRDEGRGARTVQLIHTVLHSALKQAVREGLIVRNPVDAVQRPKVERKELPILNEEEARIFLKAVSGNRLEVLYYLALITGIREGELLGLKWSDIDWKKGTLNVQRQVQRLKGQGRVFVPPKTKAGRRQIKLGRVFWLNWPPIENGRHHKKTLPLIDGKRMS